MLARDPIMLHRDRSVVHARGAASKQPERTIRLLTTGCHTATRYMLLSINESRRRQRRFAVQQ